MQVVLFLYVLWNTVHYWIHKKPDVATVSSMIKPQSLKPFYTGYNIKLSTTITQMSLSIPSSYAVPSSLECASQN